MKFWKSLSNLIEETLPDWRDKFLSYKDLKKQLKLIYPKEGDRPIKRPRLAGGGVDGRDDEEEAVANFVELLEQEIEKFNVFFEYKEEEYVMRLKRVAEANDSNEELMKVGREIVDFHGEMVLLENYSALNYTGLVKILKKYDKLSGALIRFPFIQKVLKQSFFETDVLDELVKECENILDCLFSMKDQLAPSVASDEKEGCRTKSAPVNNEKFLRVPEEPAEIENMENMYVKLTLSALRVLKEIRSGSSTVSMFSLPPLQNSELEDVWKKAPVREQ